MGGMGKRDCLLMGTGGMEDMSRNVWCQSKGGVCPHEVSRSLFKDGVIFIK